MWEKLREHAKQLETLQQALKELCDEHERLESEMPRQGGGFEESRLPSSSVPLQVVLAAVDSLMSATLPRQVFSKLTEEASRMGVRAVVFEVRNKAVWGASAHGFDAELTEPIVRSLIVPLSAETPFRQVVESGKAVKGGSGMLKNSANIQNRLKPGPGDSVLLLPIRSLGAVSGVFYADSAGMGVYLPADALQLLARFAGAQLDRLGAVSGLPAVTNSKPACRSREAGSAAI